MYENGTNKRNRTVAFVNSVNRGAWVRVDIVNSVDEYGVK